MQVERRGGTGSKRQLHALGIDPQILHKATHVMVGVILLGPDQEVNSRMHAQDSFGERLGHAESWRAVGRLLRGRNPALQCYPPQYKPRPYVHPRQPVVHLPIQHVINDIGVAAVEVVRLNHTGRPFLHEASVSLANHRIGRLQSTRPKAFNHPVQKHMVRWNQEQVVITGIG